MNNTNPIYLIESQFSDSIINSAIGGIGGAVGGSALAASYSAMASALTLLYSLMKGNEYHRTAKQRYLVKLHQDLNKKQMQLDALENNKILKLRDPKKYGESIQKIITKMDIVSELIDILEQSHSPKDIKRAIFKLQRQAATHGLRKNIKRGAIAGSIGGAIAGSISNLTKRV